MTAPPPAPPVLELQRAFEKELPSYANVYVIDGHLLVSSRYRVGKVVGDRIEWIAKATETMAGGGDNLIQSLWGRSLGELNATLRNDNGRIGTELFDAVTGEGYDTAYGPGGGYGSISGYAYLGESMVLFGRDYMGPRMEVGRGKPVERYSIPAGSVGCKTPGYQPMGAVHSWAFGGARNGMLVSAGAHCDGDKPALEVWPPNEKKPSIVKLDAWLDEQARFDAVEPVGADAVWLLPYRGTKILELRGDKVTVVHDIEGYDKGQMGADDTLYVSDKRNLWEVRGAERKIVAKLAWPTHLHAIVRHEGTFWVRVLGSVYRLVPGKDPEVLDECKTPFVHLYDVKVDVLPDFTFPATRKALSSFSGAKEVSLVEFVEGARRLGVVVPSREVGEAVVAHVKATMKDEQPRLVCYEPKSPKVHPIE